MCSVTERGPESLPTTSLGHYKVRAKIGSGGMGDVYDAVHTGLDKRVALKTLRKRFLDDEVVVARFLREGQLASRIRHPNIVDVTDVGMIGGLPCLVMEHLEGESLSSLIRRERVLKLEPAVDLLLPIIAAVDFAHVHGVLHRDLKPSNIFLSRAWNGETVPKVLDFGISKLFHESQQAALTTDSAFVGTPHYASPELMRADKDADGRSDQYSMGVILYEALTGVRPYAHLGNNFVALAMAICNGERPLPREHNADIPDAIEQVILRAMAVDPADRFASMRALGGALLPFASERARLIWTPTFASTDASAPVPPTQVPPTQVLPRMPPSAPGTAPSSAFAGGPHSVPGQPRSHVQMPLPTPAPASLTSRSRSFGDGAVPFGGGHGVHPSLTPAGASFERLPSFGAGTAAPPAPQPRGSGLLTAIIGVALGIAIVAGVVVLRANARPDGPRPVDPAAHASDAPLAGTFEIDVAVIPRTATIEIDGVAAGVGRASRSFPRDGGKHVLRLSAPGYDSLLFEFDETRLPPRDIALRPAPAPEAAPAAPKVEAPRRAPPRPPPQSAGGNKQPKADSDPRPKTDNIDPWE